MPRRVSLPARAGPGLARGLTAARSSLAVAPRRDDGPYTPRRPARGHRPGARGPNRLQQRKQAEIEALLAEGRTRIGALSDRDLLIAGTALYAGEGFKRDGALGLANTDPRIVAFFCHWLRRFFDIDESRLRLRLYLHQGLDLEVASAYWSDLTGIPPHQFGKPYRAVADPSMRRSKHPMGCPRVDYRCARTHRAVMGLVDALLA